ncbi:MAG TPA: hypothetical protein VD838_06975 [Anaeromyxobacteraceae bacterium]|nr:hypothetical protein [Anaeromyxobacteraceae bacterium]
MKKAAAVAIVVAQVVIGTLVPGASARADEAKMVGVVTKIDLAGADAKTATVTLKDVKTEDLVEIVVEDDLTLEKFKDHRIVDGDEIRCKYDDRDGKKISTYFRKTAGC